MTFCNTLTRFLSQLNYFNLPLVLVRVSDGVSPNQGRVELFVDNEWQSLCDFWWNIEAATVVCKMLGFPAASGATRGSAFGIGSASMWLHEFACDGSENHLLECPMDKYYPPDYLSYFCSDSIDEAGVTCGTPNGNY